MNNLLPLENKFLACRESSWKLNQTIKHISICKQILQLNVPLNLVTLLGFLPLPIFGGRGGGEGQLVFHPF